MGTKITFKPLFYSSPYAPTYITNTPFKCNKNKYTAPLTLDQVLLGQWRNRLKFPQKSNTPTNIDRSPNVPSWLFFWEPKKEVLGMLVLFLTT